MAELAARPDLLSVQVDAQLGVPGPSYDRLPHARIGALAAVAGVAAISVSYLLHDVLAERFPLYPDIAPYA